MTSTYVPMGSKAEVKDDDDDVDLHNPTRSSQKTPIVIIVFLSIFLLLTTIISVTFVVLYARRASSSSSSDVCQSDACFDLSVQIKGSMNEDVDPCEDFYNFTCGNWAIYNGITEGIPTWLKYIQKHVSFYTSLVAAACAQLFS